MYSLLMFLSNLVVLILKLPLLHLELVNLNSPFAMASLYPLDLILKFFLLSLAILLNLIVLLLHLDLSKLLITRSLGVSGLAHLIPVVQLAHHSVHLDLLHYLRYYDSISTYSCLYNLINNQVQPRTH